MRDGNYLALATIAGEIWGTQARATLHQPVAPVTPGTQPESRVLSYDVYFEIFGKLKEDYKKEVTYEPSETEAPDG